MLELLLTIGLITLIIVGLIFPRTIASLVLGIIIGGNWWFLFGPLIVIGVIIDVAALDN